MDSDWNRKESGVKVVVDICVVVKTVTPFIINFIGVKGYPGYLKPASKEIK